MSTPRPAAGTIEHPSTDILAAGEHASARSARDLLLDALAVACATVFVTWLSGAERFTFLHTPDSEFYFSLGAFGAEVTDRAPFDQYYWTKLGTILPVRYLTELVGIWSGREIWRVTLVLLTIASAFYVARSRMSRLGATNAALFVGLNSVILGHIGDPYATGAALAVLALTTAITFAWLFGTGQYGAPVALGGSLAWLAMINPYSLLIAAGIIAGMAIPRGRRLVQCGLLHLELRIAATLIGFGAVTGLFLFLGNREFPGKSWRTEVLSFVSTAELDTWAEPTWAWLATETSLLVPVLAVVFTAGVAWLRRESCGLCGAALGLATGPVAVAVTFKVLSQSNTLEISYYNAMLWPSALLAIVMGTLSLESGAGTRARALAVLVTTTGAWIASGHWTRQVDPGATALGILALAAFLLLVVGRRRLSEPLAVLLVLGAMGVAFQVIQNGRPPRPEAIHPRVPYADAFRKNDVGAILKLAMEFETWILSETPRGSRVLIWKEPENAELQSPAAMQLWGPNAVRTLKSGKLVSGYDYEAVENVADVVVIMASTRPLYERMGNALEMQTGFRPSSCRDFRKADGLPSRINACIHEALIVAKMNGSRREDAHG